MAGTVVLVGRMADIDRSVAVASWGTIEAWAFAGWEDVKDVDDSDGADTAAVDIAAAVHPRVD